MSNNYPEGTTPTDTPTPEDHMRRLMEEDASLSRSSVCVTPTTIEPEHNFTFHPMEKPASTDVGDTGWLDALTVSKTLGVSRAWVSRLCQTGELEHTRVPGRGRSGYTLRINPESVAAYQSRPRSTESVPDGYITVDSLSDLLGIGRPGIYYMMKTGKVRADKQGRRWIITQESVNEHIRELARRQNNANHFISQK